MKQNFITLLRINGKQLNEQKSLDITFTKDTQTGEVTETYNCSGVLKDQDSCIFESLKKGDLVRLDVIKQSNNNCIYTSQAHVTDISNDSKKYDLVFTCTR